jgi:hypothetical protein
MAPNNFLHQLISNPWLIPAQKLFTTMQLFALLPKQKLVRRVQTQTIALAAKPLQGHGVP